MALMTFNTDYKGLILFAFVILCGPTQIRDIPESMGPFMTALTDLDLSNNEILRLPNTVGDLTSLTMLKVRAHIAYNDHGRRNKCLQTSR